MAARKILTEAGIRAAIAKAQKAGKAVWKSDGAIPRSHGGLQLFVHPNGDPRWYYRYTKADGTSPRLPMGAHTFSKGNGETTFTLTQARERAAELAAVYQRAESRDVRAHLTREAEARAQARIQASAEAAAAGRLTLAHLLAAYVAQLRRHGKESAGDAENIFANHVSTAHPALAAKLAREITARDVVAMLRTLTEAGKGRTAAKLRAYLRAAYAIAARAAIDSDAPAAFLPFGVEANPVQATAALSQYNRALERALNEQELREFWATVKAAPDSHARDALLLLLLLGGQRVAQLLRATVTDVDTHANVLRLRDPKGKRTQPRVHALPFPELAAPIIARCLARAEKQKSAWLFSTRGDAPLRPETVTQAAADIAAALLAKPKAERVVREPFQLRDLRRTAETEMARMGVPKDIRAQIQSHGLGGIQGRHYDKHDYLAEKRAALAAWAQFLETAPVANVTRIGERRSRRGGIRGR